MFRLSTVLDGAPGASLAKDTCSRQSSTRILCSIGPGSGKNLVWRVVVGPDVFVSVAPLTLSFTPPVISGVSGAERMPTVGGSAVTITGTSFGPLPSIVVFYGPVRDPMRYTATNCTLLAMDTVLRCLRYALQWFTILPCEKRALHPLLVLHVCTQCPWRRRRAAVEHLGRQQFRRVVPGSYIGTWRILRVVVHAASGPEGYTLGDHAEHARRGKLLSSTLMLMLL